MGASQSSRIPLDTPPSVNEFRKCDPSNACIIPELSFNRKVTDKPFAIVFAVFITLFMPFLLYTLAYADLDIFLHGYDKCGNICGAKNSPIAGLECSGKDLTNEPYGHFRRNGEDMKCTSQCYKNEVALYYMCFPVDGLERNRTNESKDQINSGLNSFNQDHEHTHSDNDFFESLSKISSDLHKSAGQIVSICIVGLCLSVGMLFLYRYCISFVVWFILIGSVFGIVALSAFFWYLDSKEEDYNSMYSEIKQPRSNIARAWAVIFSIISLILIVIMVCMIKRIKLVIRLFKESIKTVFGIPLILIEPIFTFVALLILYLAFSGILTYICASSTFSLETQEYESLKIVPFVVIYHVVIVVWMYKFIVGCQDMVVSGAVSTYYFTKDKSTLSMTGPIYTSFYNLIRYHLGTVALGSMVLTLIAIIKVLVRSLAKNKIIGALLNCCLSYLEDFLKFLSKNALIMTAMHGQPFFKSGKRAVKLLVANALNVIAVNSVGDFVLFMTQLLIVLCTALFGILIDDGTVENFWAAIIIGVLVTAVIAHAFFTVFETTVDTLFLCFCEDISINNGTDNQYYMSVNLMQYIEDAKAAYKVPTN